MNSDDQSEMKPVATTPEGSEQRIVMPASADFDWGTSLPAGRIIAALVAAEGRRSDAIELLARICTGFGITGEEIQHYQEQPQDVLGDSPEWRRWHDAAIRLAEAAGRAKRA